MSDTDIPSEPASIIRWRSSFVLIAFSVLLAACGGGGESGGGSDGGSSSGSESSIVASTSDSSSGGSDSDESSSDAAATPSGGGENIVIVEVNGVTYTASGGLCNAFDEYFLYGGVGTGSDGSSAFLDLEYDGNYSGYRARVVVGGTSEVDYQNDQPSWIAWDILIGDITLNYSDGTVTGEGEAEDFSQVVLPAGETTPIVVRQASCG